MTNTELLMDLVRRVVAIEELLNIRSPGGGSVLTGYGIHKTDSSSPHPPMGEAPASEYSRRRKVDSNPGISLPRPKKIAYDWATGEFSGITDQMVDRWKDTYPAVDVDVEIGVAAQWLLADKRRAKSDYQRFLTNWFSRKQDRGGSKPWLNQGRR